MSDEDDFFKTQYIVKAIRKDGSKTETAFNNTFLAERFADAELNCDEVVAIELLELKLKWRQVKHGV